uniref:Desiccation-related protein PCC13-62-like n=1 Tax=Steinernema glaseri TaxID=37863 RepID=A0A1I7ZSW5_9BILA
GGLSAIAPILNVVISLLNTVLGIVKQLPVAGGVAGSLPVGNLVGNLPLGAIAKHVGNAVEYERAF